MSRYEYTAMDSNGREINGKVGNDTTTENDAVRILKEQGLFPTSVKKIKKNKKSETGTYDPNKILENMQPFDHRTQNSIDDEAEKKLGVLDYMNIGGDVLMDSMIYILVIPIISIIGSPLLLIGWIAHKFFNVEKK